MFDDQMLNGPPEAWDGDSPIRERMSIPPGLDRMEPGPVMAAFLSIVDPDELSGYDRVVVLRAHQKLVSHYEAKLLADVAAVSDAYMEEAEYDHETANDAAVMELRAALRLTRRSAQIKVDLADTVSERLPRVGAALADGSIDMARSRVIAYGTSHLDQDSAREVVDRVIENAPHLTTGQLAAKVRKLCMAIEPEEAETRYQHAVEGRRLVREATDEGTANLMIMDAPPK